MIPLTTQRARIAAIERVLDAIERRDPDAIRGLAAEQCHPGLEWSPRITGVEGQIYHGPEGLVSFYEDLLDSFDVRYTNREFREIGDQAILFLWKMEFRGRESAIDFSREMGVIWEFEDDLFRRGVAYDSHTEAIAAAEALSHAQA